MSFKDLKQRKNSLQKLQSQIEEATKTTGTVDERFWKPEKDKAGNAMAIIRFLPAPEGEDMPFVKMYSHYFQGPGGWYVENSLTTIGKSDPIGEYNRELWNSGTEEAKNQVRKQKRKLHYYSNVYIVKDPANPENEGQVFLFQYGKKIFDKIMNVVNGDELEERPGINPFDLWEGVDFKLRIKKVEGYPNYDDSSFSLTPTTLGGLDDSQLESIWKREYPLRPLVSDDKFKSYEELQQSLDRALGRGTRSESTQESEPVRIVKPPVENQLRESPNFNKPTEEEAIDYFNRMLEEEEVEV